MKSKILTLLATTLLAAPVFANPMEGVVSIDVLPGWRTSEGTHMAGLEIKLAPGWKTYWRAPGDAGIPPSFDWSGVENISGAAFHWPVPEVMWQNDMRSIGYHGDVVIPVEFSLEDAEAVARMQGEVLIGVCQDICVPMQVSFDALLPENGARDPKIIAALLDRPRSASEAGVGAVTCALLPTDNGIAITTRVSMPPIGEDEVVVIEAGNQEVWVSEPQAHREGGDLIASAEMIHVSGGAFALDRSGVRITVFGASQTVDIQGCTGG